MIIKQARIARNKTYQHVFFIHLAATAQMFHTGWKARLLPAREIRLFLTDSRKSSVIYWRYKKNPRRGRRVTGGAGDLGAEDRLVSVVGLSCARRNCVLASESCVGPLRVSTCASAPPRPDFIRVREGDQGVETCTGLHLNRLKKLTRLLPRRDYISTQTYFSTSLSR